MRAFFTSLLEYSPVLAAVLVTALVMWGIMRWINKFYNKVERTEEKVNAIQVEMKDVATKTDVERTEEKVSAIQLEMVTKVERTEEKINTIEVEMATKKDVAMLKENDMFHTNKALLIGFSLILKKDQEQGFERMKDIILETTPDNKKDEIKSITL